MRRRLRVSHIKCCWTSSLSVLQSLVRRLIYLFWLMMLCPLCFVPWLGSPVPVPVWFIPKKGTFNEEIIDRSGCQEGLASNLSLLTHKVNPGRSHLSLFLQPQFSAGMRPVVHSFEWGQKGYRNEIVGVTLLWKLEGSIHRCQGFCAWPCTFEILVRFTLKTTLLLPLNLLMKQYANVCVCVFHGGGLALILPALGCRYVSFSGDRAW